MRNKVYGKRGKGVLGTRSAVFEQDSPNANSVPRDENTKVSRPPLKEWSGNLEGRTHGEKDANDDSEGLEDCKTKCRVSAPQPTAKPIEKSVKKNDRIKRDIHPVDKIGHGGDAVDDTLPYVQPSSIGNLGPKESMYQPRTKRDETSSSRKVNEIAKLLQEKLVVTETSYRHYEDITSVRASIPTATPAFHGQPALLDTETASYVSPLLTCRNVSGRVENFQAWTDVRMPSLKMQKIGEGSFGEVYRATNGGETVILKIIPLNARKGRGSRTFTSIEAAANEVQLLEKMQRIPGFVEFRGACVLRGCMPSQLVKEWKDYKAQGRTVESRDPTKKNAYSEKQIWLLIEMSDAGTNLNPGHYMPCDIECYTPGDRYLSVQRSWDIFWQIVRALAKAEVYAEFEHRDLHLGNICAKNSGATDDKEILTLVPLAEATPFSVDSTGVQATIIDYSLARAIADEDQILSYDFMKDDSLLTGEGELQYDIYRYMAEDMGEKDCKEFVPKTNVLWLSYLVIKLLEVTVELSEEAKIEESGRVTVTAKMKAILEEVRKVTALSQRHNWALQSAEDLLALGTHNKWFTLEEIIDG